MKQNIPSAKVRVGPLSVVLMIRALQGGPHTYAELSQACGLHHTTLRRWLPAFRKDTRAKPRLVHVAGWEEDALGRCTTPSFAWGDEPDAPRCSVSNADRQRRRRAAARAKRLSAALTA